MKTLGIVLGSLILLAALAGGGIAFVFFHYGRDLPDHKQLAAYEPPVMTRVYAGDGRLLAEHARQKRLFVPLAAMPRRLIQAFLAAEDKAFYEHFGVDPISVANAVVTNLVNMAGSGDRRPIGASTVTQQVAKNFLLSGELSFSRKIREAILAMRIEDAFTKDRILELYLNEIYLGGGSYGVAAAALNYFDRSLNDLSLAELAYLAALPKAPNNYHPVRRHDAAVARRNWVLGQMVANRAVSAAEAEAAMQVPLRTRERAPETFVEAQHFAEEVRRWLQDHYGDDTLYEGGLSVRTTVDPALQAIADGALRGGLVAYDMRRGWRGPLARIDPAGDWRQALAGAELSPVPAPWRLAAVLAVAPESAEIGFADGTRSTIALDDLKWARKARAGRPAGAGGRRRGGRARRGRRGAGRARRRRWRDLCAPPDSRGLGCPGGAGPAQRAGAGAGRRIRLRHQRVRPRDPGAAPAGFRLQAVRLPGGARQRLHAGLHRARCAGGDRPGRAPAQVEAGELHPALLWAEHAPGRPRGIAQPDDAAPRPGDRHGRRGRLRPALRAPPDLPRMPSAALGSMETTPLDLAAAYAMVVNGGRRIEPAFVERIQDRNGRTVYRRDGRECAHCRAGEWRHQLPPVLRDLRPVIADPRTTYQVVSMLEGAVQRGTGRALRPLAAPIGGKTGTTNEFRDAWFVGFTPDLVVATYVGFDQPQSLGRKESGGRVAAPIVRDFFAQALAGKPAVPFRVPPGIRFVRVERESGALPGPESDDIIVEAFLAGSEPTQRAALKERNGANGAHESGAVSFEGLGDVY